MDRFHRAIITICYLFGIMPSGLILMVERKDMRIRFHAAQSLLFHITLLAIFVPLSCLGTWIVIEYSKPVGIGTMAAATLFEIIMLAAWLRLLIGALGGGEPRLPVFARLAERTVSPNRSSTPAKGDQALSSQSEGINRKNKK